MAHEAPVEMRNPRCGASSGQLFVDRCGGARPRQARSRFQRSEEGPEFLDLAERRKESLCETFNLVL
jgi:hypothetical protein